MSYLPHLLLILVAVSIGATVIAIIISHRCRREARSTIFPVVREEEALRARWANIFTVFSSGLTVLFLGAWLFNLVVQPSTGAATESVAVSLASTAESTAMMVAFTPTEVTVPPAPPTENSAIPLPSPTAESSQPVTTAEELIIPSVTPSPTEAFLQPASIPSATSVVVMVRSSAGTPTPTSSAATILNDSGQSAADLLRAAKITTTPILSSPGMHSSSAVVLVTATPPVDVLLRTSITPSQLLSAGSRASSGQANQLPPQLGPIAFTTDFDSAENVQSRQQFPVDVRRVFAIYPFSGMQNGSQFTAVWYYDGQELWRDSQIWQWGNEASSYTYINNSGQGPYRLELYVNDDLLASGSFEVR